MAFPAFCSLQPQSCAKSSYINSPSGAPFMKCLRLLTAFAWIGLALSASNALAHTGSLSFTEEEKALHEPGVDQILSTAAACLERDIAHHKDFFKRYGISPYFGDRSAFGKLSTAEKKTYLRRL